MDCHDLFQKPDHQVESLQETLTKEMKNKLTQDLVIVFSPLVFQIFFSLVVAQKKNPRNKHPSTE